MKIITVTLNPCIDINYKLDFPFKAGELNRVPTPKESVNGKGINVSRELKRLGEESVTMGIFADDGADETLRREGLTVTSVICHGRTRKNTSILDSEGNETQINEPGFDIPEDTLREFIGMYKSELNSGDKTVVILSGSIPPGVDVGIYRKLSTIAKNSDAYVILDTSGKALEKGLDGMPDLIKPNKEEFEELTGKTLTGTGEGLRIDAVRAALEFCRNNNVAVLLTLGEEGSVFAGPEGSYMCDARKTEIETFKGAGDTFLASFVYEHIVREKDCDLSLMLASTETSRYLSGKN